MSGVAGEPTGEGAALARAARGGTGPGHDPSPPAPRETRAGQDNNGSDVGRVPDDLDEAAQRAREHGADEGSVPAAGRSTLSGAESRTTSQVPLSQLEHTALEH
jgi:hypothetical protein